jgi:multisubunit Na+/H+ antiporter MnhB subunit
MKMKEWHKKLFIIFILIGILSIFIIAYSDIVTSKTNVSRDYYIDNTYKETGSKNFVTGIYLDYRLFDSVFEAGILIITATGIVFMAKKEH